MKVSNFIARMAMMAALGLSAYSHTHHQIDDSQSQFTINAKGQYAKIMKSLRERGIDVLGVDIPNSLIDVSVNQQEEGLLKQAKLKLTKIKKQKAEIDSRYLNTTELEALLKKTHEEYPDITKLKKVGETLEGNAIWAIKISDNAAVEEAHEPAVLFNGMHHSREIMTIEVTSDIVTYLTKNYASDVKVKNWVDQNEIWVLPVLNVDGNIKVWNGQEMWRKNARGGYGVDINRNYPTNWNACRGSSGWRNSQTYRGSEAASEPETKVMMNFVSEIKPVFNISYHAYSELIIYPYGCRGQRTTNREVVEGIGKEMGTILNYTPGTSWETLYSVDGSDIDWMYQEEQVIPYVIEVSPRSDGFQPNYEKRDPTVEHNRQGWQFLLDRLAGPAISGVNKDYKEILIEKNIDGAYQEVQTYRVNPDGSYHIILNEGQYKATFKGSQIQTKHFNL
ncbi:M14 family metallopeptidase [Bacteriovorax sp. DB6_IX]|uniref:M14 family metallopeptidase n=1 Tax=Bacteriovorax sp. DB6_IX TaxID=1353530 RepID=UPI00038A40B7|nr:M14 family metallopeptidase [Bacteriovorax sp. DB6_IX]EQC51489.1 zinc carboxypeptidase family protein [Bacteriovorax sp. DB6_IX]